MRFIDKVIGFVIAVSLIPSILTVVTDLTAETVYDVDGTTVLTEGGALEATAAGAILELAPLVLVAGVITWFYLKNKR